ncbi:MAG: hypothetical protein PHQ70_03105 [Arcobacter sp.]|uniref:anti-phage protein KwaA n=1 Tax=Arcobacter sp. TaxID=1872629 RepID=UPI00258D2D0F|nr:anti-phage protein KwaA [Arcobacter sp.]MDD3007841.1 hypothetical protein [Arcobacter sp.]
MSLFAKILLYNLSLVPLYILFMIQKFDNTNITIDKITQEYKNIEYYKEIAFNNIIGLIFLFLVIFSYLTYKKFIKELNSQSDLPQKFENIKNIDFNHLTFIATYIIPLLAFKLDTIQDIIFLLVLLIFIGAIYIKTNLYYLSPVFALFGFKIFSATTSSQNECILMTQRDKLKSNDMLKFMKIGDIYFIKKENSNG